MQQKNVCKLWIPIISPIENLKIHILQVYITTMSINALTYIYLLFVIIHNILLNSQVTSTNQSINQFLYSWLPFISVIYMSQSQLTRPPNRRSFQRPWIAMLGQIGFLPQQKLYIDMYMLSLARGTNLHILPDFLPLWDFKN